MCVCVFPRLPREQIIFCSVLQHVGGGGSGGGGREGGEGGGGETERLRSTSYYCWLLLLRVSVSDSETCDACYCEDDRKAPRPRSSPLDDLPLGGGVDAFLGPCSLGKLLMGGGSAWWAASRA